MQSFIQLPLAYMYQSRRESSQEELCTPYHFSAHQARRQTTWTKCTPVEH